MSPTVHALPADLAAELASGGQRRWLVTGAAGFIGSHLVETLLRAGQTVVGMDNFATGYRHTLDAALDAAGGGAAERWTFHESDLRDLDACRRACAGATAVLHQAALGSVPRSVADPLTTHAVNVDGTVNLLVAARDAGVGRFVYASSSSVYGDHPGLPKVEDVVGMPLSPYAVTKRTGELYARTFFDHYGLETVGLRYFNVFGPRQDPDGPYAAVIPKWTAALLRGEPCTIYGDGETSRDFCYVANVVQANLRAALGPAATAGKVYNVAVGDRTTLGQLHEHLVALLAERGEVSPETMPVYADFRPGDIRHSHADTARIRAAFGYAPTHTLLDGLRLALDGYVAEARTLPGAPSSPATRPPRALISVSSADTTLR